MLFAKEKDGIGLRLADLVSPLPNLRLAAALPTGAVEQSCQLAKGGGERNQVASSAFLAGGKKNNRHNWLLCT